MTDEQKSYIKQLTVDEVVQFVACGVLSINEVRAVHDLPPVEGGDEPTVFTHIGLIRVGDIDKHIGA